MKNWFPACLTSLLINLFVIEGAISQSASPSITTEVYQDWTYRCEIIDANKDQKNCEVLQSVSDQSGAVISQIAIGKGLAENQLLLVLQLPQGTLLSSTPKIADQSGTLDLVIPYFSCFQNVCLAKTDVEFDILEKIANSDDLAIAVMDRSSQLLTIRMSPKGLAAAIERLRSAL